MFCENCGAKLAEDAMFCINCGAKTAPCGTEHEEDDKTVILYAEDAYQTTGTTETLAAPGDGSGEAEPAAGSESVEAEPAAENEPIEAEPVANAGGETVETVEISPTGSVAAGTAVVVPEAVAPKKFCPNCGAANGMSDLFCQECGMFFGSAAEKMGSGDASGKAHKKGFAGKIVAIAAAAIAVIGLVVVASRILGGMAAQNQEQDFVMYVKDNELTMARKNKYEPLLIGDKVFDEPDEHVGEGISYEIQYSPNYEYVYYPQKIEDEGCELYRKKIGSKKAEEEKIDSHVQYYGIIGDDKLYYVKDSAEQKLYLYHEGKSEKVASNVRNVQVSADEKYLMWISDGRLYVQNTDLKEDKVKLDSDVFLLYDVSDDFNTIVYQKEDKLYVMRGMEEKEKIASDVYMAYTYDINKNLKMYYLKTEGQSDLSYYDLVEDDCLVQDQQMAEPRMEDYQRVTYKDSFWGVQERVEVDDSYYEDLDKYQQKQERDYLRNNLEGNLLTVGESTVYYYEDAEGESNKIMTVLYEQLGQSAFTKVGTNRALLCVRNIDIEQMDEIQLSKLTDTDYYEIQQKVEKQFREGRQLLYLDNGTVHEIEDYEFDDELYNENTGYQLYSVWANEEKQTLYITKDGVGDEGQKLYSLDYGKKDAALELITDELGRVVSWDMDEICYLNEDEELYYGDAQIAEDVGRCKVGENGALLYLEDMDKEGREGTLHLYQDGKDTKIADDVTVGYQMFGKDKVAFLTDYNFKKYYGDLNVYDGNKVKNIDSEVSYIIF